jgi:hypothetical protein
MEERASVDRYGACFEDQLSPIGVQFSTVSREIKLFSLRNWAIKVVSQ